MTEAHRMVGGITGRSIGSRVLDQPRRAARAPEPRRDPATAPVIGLAAPLRTARVCTVQTPPCRRGLAGSGPHRSRSWFLEQRRRRGAVAGVRCHRRGRGGGSPDRRPACRRGRPGAGGLRQRHRGGEGHRVAHRRRRVSSRPGIGVPCGLCTVQTQTEHWSARSRERKGRGQDRSAGSRFQSQVAPGPPVSPSGPALVG